MRNAACGSHAIYVVQGEVEIAGENFEAPRLLIFRPGDRITVRAIPRAPPHVSRRLGFGGNLVEFRVVPAREDRASQGRLEVRPVCAGSR